MAENASIKASQSSYSRNCEKPRYALASTKYIPVSFPFGMNHEVTEEHSKRDQLPNDRPCFLLAGGSSRCSGILLGSRCDPRNDPILGTGLGGSGTWDSVSGNWFDGTSIVPWGNTTADDAIFTGPVSAPATVTVDAGGITANSLSFWRVVTSYRVVRSTWVERRLVSKLALVRPQRSTV